MSNSIITNKFVVAAAAQVFDQLNYLKNSYAPFDFSVGSQAGSVARLVLRDGGKVTDGIVMTDADRTGMQERVIYGWRSQKKACIEADVIAKVIDLASWTEYIKSTSIKLAIAIQQEVIDTEYFKTGVVCANSNPWAALSDAAMATVTARQGSTVTGYIAPRAQGAIAAKAIGGYTFGIASDAAKNLYAENSIGQYAGVEFINIPEIPEVKVPSGITGLAVNSALVINATHYGESIPETYLEMVAATGVTATLPKGYAFNLPEVYSTNVQGAKSPYEFGFVLQDAVTLNGATPVNAKVQSLITANCYARNCYIGDGTNSAENLAAVSGTVDVILSAGTTYWPCEIRTKEALVFQGIDQADLDGAKNESGSVGEVKISITSLGDITNKNNITREDVAYVAVKGDIRGSSMAYIAKV